ncbi:MAG TPA: M20/M25/M40 family metallo-hydrolase [Candidatus Cryosericum sp.]|nr:M20/M25/M40 family metallo-hydrolase [Candidatus Cryosericum sp.]
MFETKELVELVKQLVSIDTSNSFLVPGSPDELEGQKFAQDYLRRLGVASEIERVGDSSHYNLAAVLPGEGGGNNLTLYAHMDTVGYALWKERALCAVVEGDTIVGLGASDDKGFCAVMMIVAKALVESGIRLKGDLHLCFCSDEEGATCGSFDYVKRHAPEAALIMESAPINRVNVTHQGFGWLKIKVFGKAGHGSAGGDSLDAIAAMAEVIVRLQRNQRENFAKNPHPLNGETVYHTGTISGGTDFATYPAHCELGIEIGTQPGETMNHRIEEIKAVFREVKELYPGFSAEIEPVIVRSPFESRGAEELYAVLAEEIERATGKPAEAVGENSWGDAEIFQDGGFPTLGIGSLGGNFHAPDEWVSISELDQFTRMLINVVKRYCGVAE